MKVVVHKPQLVTTEIRETEFRSFDDIVKLEERVQDKKARQLTLDQKKHHDAEYRLRWEAIKVK